MNLHFSENDWARIEKDWTAFWTGKLGRPMVWMEYYDPSIPKVNEYRYFFPNYPLSMSAQEVIAIESRHLERIRYGGDAFPKRFLNFGPGSMAAYLGSRLDPANNTVWFHPTGKTIQEITIKTDKDAYWYKRAHDILDTALQNWGNRVQMSFSDIGGNLDILASLRGTEELLMDMLDEPDTVEKLTHEITREWLKVYEEEADKIKSVCHGTTPWAPIWSKEKSFMLQCDLSYMFSTELFDRFVVPDIEACCENIPASFYHLDGKNALKHLDSLLAIKKLKGIQWVPGEGQPWPHDWPEVLRKIRDGGKFCQIYTTPEGALKLKRNMDLNGFILNVEYYQNVTSEEVQQLFKTLIE